MNKIFIFILLFLGVVTAASSQISCPNAILSDTTSYTNGAPNDSLFFFCQNQTATLVATPPGGASPWDFIWQTFESGTNSWVPFITVNDVLTSTQTDLLPNGYRCQIIDANNETVGIYIAWVVRQVTNPSVNVQPISAGCGNVQLTANLTYGSTTNYYNPPTAFDPDDVLIVDETTTITVCFSGTHSFVSDLAFYIIGPASCGSPVVVLSANPGTNCNAGNNIANLCFTTNSSPNFNVCTAAVPLTGTYDSYGAASTPINWAALYGCDASQSGWTVQIWDCAAIDTGALTDATLTFAGTSEGGDDVTYVYSTPSGFNSAINDNSCNSNSASTFTVPAAPPTAISFTYGFEWTAEPDFVIPNNTTSLNITLNPGPQVDTEFTFTITGTNPSSLCGGVGTDTELYDFSPPPTINPIEEIYCTSSPAFNLSSPQTGGTWSGTGITSGANGTFDPTTAGPGEWTISYMLPNCNVPSTIDIVVLDASEPPLQDPGVLCENGANVDLNVTAGNGGAWTGPGIIDEDTGLFSPAAAGAGTHTISYYDASACEIFGSYEVVVQEAVIPEITSGTIYCENDGDIALTADGAGGVWLGEGVTGSVFSPSQTGPGTFEITYSIGGNCPASDVTVFVVDDVNVVNLTVPESVCTASGEVSLIADLPGGVWSGDGVSGNSFDPIEAGVGNNTVTYSFNDACNSTASEVILVIESPEVNILSPANACINGGIVLLNADIPGGNWSGDGVNGDQFDPTFNGVGQVTITYEIDGACPAIDTQTMTVNAAPVVNAGNNTEICEDESTVLNASGAVSYAWSPGTGLSSSTTANPTASPNTTTTYTVVGTDANNCSSSDQVTVTVNMNPIVTATALGVTPICQGEEIELQVNGLTSASWSPAGSLTGAITLNPTASPNNTQQYTVNGFDDNGCPGTATVTVSVTIVNANFNANPEEGLSPVDVIFENNSNGELFNWDFGNGNVLIGDDEGINPEQTYVDGGTYTITLTAFIDDCSATSTETVFVYFDSRVDKIPNIITPNGSDGNEVFRVDAANMEFADIRIYNRWGKEVGAITSPKGFWAPGDLSEGTYFYVVKLEGYDGKKYAFEGSLTIMR